jgi:type II secretory pathway component PulK
MILATTVGVATGSKAAAAALACAASEPDRAALLIDLDDGRALRPSLIATAGARALEERLAAHLPHAEAASRGRVCHLKLPADPDGIEGIAAALPLVRESAAVVHLPPRLLRPLLEDTRVQPTTALLRADIADDRALTALVARDLMERSLRVAVLKRPLAWLPARRALLGALPGGGLPARMCERLLEEGGLRGSPRARYRRP